MAKHKNHLPNEEPLGAADIPEELKTMPKEDWWHHGAWNKEEQRYADGCDSDAPPHTDPPTPTPGPLPGLTDAETEAYLDAIGDDDEEETFPEDPGDEPEEPFIVEATPELPRVIVAASSSWMNHAALERELFNWWHANNMVPVYIQIGDCPIGGEPMAIQSIKEFGLPFQVWNADTITPAQRDRAMVAAGADIAFIFLDEDSEGASRVRDLCIGAGIPTIVTSRNVYRPHRRYEDQ